MKKTTATARPTAKPTAVPADLLQRVAATRLASTSSAKPPKSSRLARLPKAARKAWRKAARKLKTALRSADLSSLAIAVGMAQAAVSKAQFAVACAA